MVHAEGLSHWLRGLICKVFLDRIVARAEAPFIGYAVSPARLSSIVSPLAQKRLSHWLLGLTCEVSLDRIVPHAAGSSSQLLQVLECYLSGAAVGPDCGS